MVADGLALPLAAPQQSRGPRPLPLFLSLVAEAASRDPALAAQALEGLKRYQQASLPPPGPPRPVVAHHGGATLRDCGGSGPVVVLVPSLINPPTILDLDPGCSLADALSARHRVLLLDWGCAAEREGLDLRGHVERLLLPLMEEAGRPALVGYCLGGTLALAAAVRTPEVAGVVTLASPWRFGAYPAEARRRLLEVWQTASPAAARLGSLPMEVLQTAFWQVDPERLVAKFAHFARMQEESAEAQRFAALEDWANGGEPLPLPAARDLVEDQFGRGGTIGELPSCPTLHFTARGDRIVPEGTVAPGPRIGCPAGHVGMVVGRQARTTLHEPLLSWLEGVHRSR